MDWIIPIQQPYGPSTSFLFSEHDPNMSDFHSSLTPCYETHGKKKKHPLGPLGLCPSHFICQVVANLPHLAGVFEHCTCFVSKEQVYSLSRVIVIVDDSYSVVV